MGSLLEGKICLVTGASRGIGKAIAELFAAEGAVVYANSRGGRKAGPDGSGEAGSPGEAAFTEEDRIRPVYFDCADEEAARRAVFSIYREHGRIDVLVNNAGIVYNEPIGMISMKHVEEMLRVNVYGTINMLQLTSRLMMRGRAGGSIINISSVTGIYGNPGQSAYSSTKGAVISLTKSAAKELGPMRIRVNAIAPGLTLAGEAYKTDPAKIKERIGNIRLGRAAEPEDIAKACLFLASDLSGFVSGQIIAADGCTVM